LGHTLIVFPGNCASFNLNGFARLEEKMIHFDANAVVHINDTLSNEEIHGIEKRLAGVRGIVSACAHVKTPHLMVVDYDPQTIHSRELLSHFRREGMNASLIGGI
jgi:hypothetical protein